MTIFVGAALGCADDAPPPPKNVILIILDTTRADHLGVYGHERNTTPHIDRLAKQSFVFDRAYASSSWTRPSIASILSSRWTHEHGILSEAFDERLDKAVTTLPEYFKTRGYATAGFYTNPHFRFGLEQGLDHRKFKSGASAEWVYDGAIRWLDRVGQKPFFLLLHNIDPHDHYLHHDAFPFAPIDSRFRDLDDLFPGPGRGVGKSCANQAVPLSESELAEMRACYDQEIAYTDHHLGRLLAVLKKRGLMKNTAIIITADHGEEFYDHGSLWHGCTLYDELVRVPLIVYLPGRKGKRIKAPASLLDIYPTLVDLFPPTSDETSDESPGEISEDELALSGRSLMPLFEGKRRSPSPQYLATGFRGPVRQAVLLGDFKLIRDTAGHHELYYLRTDPREQHNLAAAPVAKLVVPTLLDLERRYPDTAP